MISANTPPRVTLHCQLPGVVNFRLSTSQCQLYKGTQQSVNFTAGETCWLKTQNRNSRGVDNLRESPRPFHTKRHVHVLQERLLLLDLRLQALILKSTCRLLKNRSNRPYPISPHLRESPRPSHTEQNPRQNQEMASNPVQIELQPRRAHPTETKVKSGT